MPIYEYQCKKCKHRFDYLARTFSDAPGTCPKCGAHRPKKQISTFNATVHDARETPACPTGTCPTATCPTGTCSLN